MVFVTEDFARTTVELHGEVGRLWLRSLPAVVEECAARWSLKVFPPFTPLSYNYAAPAEGPGGARLVLKLGVPVRELMTEIEALRAFDGRGAARLVEFDAEAGALLIERLEPGTPLIRLCESDDEAATTAAASVMRKLWRPVPAVHPFPTVADWGKGFQKLRARFGGGTGPFPRATIEEAETLFAELLKSSAEPVLLHGDLHHGNILAAAREPWLAIDPKGLVGEPAYEVGALLRNPLPQLLQWPQPVRASERRIAQLSEELGVERERVRGWGLAQAVLSAWWSVEDTGERGEFDLAAAEILASTKI
ncbi:MAG TPA: aminoglycoside phosphotransferase family protein [Pyrinomonadaceae bacterium]|nr:aminoglycoside phosphotransferase family protein [Pyrinomonadaceae bacterium]